VIFKGLYSQIPLKKRYSLCLKKVQKKKKRRRGEVMISLLKVSKKVPAL